MTSAKQQKLQPEGIPDTASIVVPADKIPKGLSPADRNILLVNCDRAITTQLIVWFRDCPEVRRILQMPEERKDE